VTKKKREGGYFKELQLLLDASIFSQQLNNLGGGVKHVWELSNLLLRILQRLPTKVKSF
jgi:hypothetical protein